MQDCSELIARGTRLGILQHERYDQKTLLYTNITNLGEEIKQKQHELDTHLCACNLIANVSDAVTQETLDKITGVINKALGVLFPNDTRTIKITKRLHNDTYPHFIVELKTAEGYTRTFKQSGSGLAQVISVLFNLCLIDARGGRKIVAMDELLGGLHPDAKQIVAELMLALSDRFQFVFVEYGLDIGKQYVVKMNKGTSTITPYENTYGGYYTDLTMKKVKTPTSVDAD
jgi:hypothetical protein